MAQSISKKTRHGAAMSAIALTLVVPAFAGTTFRIASGIT
jgi:hypothetical protein